MIIGDIVEQYSILRNNICDILPLSWNEILISHLRENFLSVYGQGMLDLGSYFLMGIVIIFICVFLMI